MLRSLKEITKYKIVAKDDDVGSVRDFFFDDGSWAVRYLVADTGKWLPGRRVLLAPVAISGIDWSARQLHVSLNRKQIENSPGVESDRPVSRQKERELSLYYGWPIYWGAPVPVGIPAVGDYVSTAPDDQDGDSALRSAREVTGYHIAAQDGAVGHVEDFLASEEDWYIRYMVVDTRNWLPGRKVLVAPWMIDAVDWANKEVRVDRTQAQVKASPEYNPVSPVSRAYEAEFYEFYGHTAYWKS